MLSAILPLMSSADYDYYTVAYLLIHLIYIVMYLLVGIEVFIMFKKAGEAGWKILIPIYSTYILYKIIYGDGWKILLRFIPIYNIIFSIKTIIDLAKVYGKSTGFGVLTIFFPPITLGIIAFGDAQYLGPYN